MRQIRRRIAVVAMLAAAMANPPVPAWPSDCEQAGQAAEQKYALPPGLLRAIGQVESGRWDTGLGRAAAWPWSIDVDGAARYFGDSEEAIRETEALQASGHRSIDIGCFQISLLYHPAAFADLQQAFHPESNADYAARFLVSLKERLGSWPAAIAAYHSADAARGFPYRDRVMAAWNPSTKDVSTAPVPAAAAVPVVAFGVRVWGPSPPGSASAVVALPAESSGAIPHVITP